MVDIQSVTAEIRCGKVERRRKKERNHKAKISAINIMSASATQGGHK